MDCILRLEQLRKERGLSQKALAKKLNVNTKTIKHWEQTQKIKSIKHVIAIVLFFNVSVDYLCGLSNERIHKQKNNGD